MNDGGPAFPQPIATTDTGNRDFSAEFGWGGMTLRDYFAGQAMAGVLASGAHQELTNHCEWSGSSSKEALCDANKALARLAGSIADAMLAERTATT